MAQLPPEVCAVVRPGEKFAWKDYETVAEQQVGFCKIATAALGEPAAMQGTDVMLARVKP